MAFTFGPLMPIFFIYAFLGLFILDVTLRCRIAYSVRRFPIYDQKMNKAMLVGMRYLPLIYYINSSWFYSNQQLFKNYVYANDSHSALFAPSGHYFKQLFTQLTPGTIYVIMVGLLLLLTLISVTFRIFRSCCKCRLGHSKYWDFDKIVTCKKVCNFTETLTNHQRESWLREEVGTRMRLGIEHLSDESIGQLMLSHEIEERDDKDDDEEDIAEN